LAEADTTLEEGQGGEKSGSSGKKVASDAMSEKERVRFSERIRELVDELPRSHSIE